MEEQNPCSRPHINSNLQLYDQNPVFVKFNLVQDKFNLLTVILLTQA